MQNNTFCKESYGYSFLGPSRHATGWFPYSWNNHKCWQLLCYGWVNCKRQFALDCSYQMPCCCSTMPDHIQPQLHTICYSLSGGRFWTTLLTVSTLHQEITISLDLWRSRGQLFRTDAEVQQAILMWLHNLDTDFLNADFDGLVYQWNKCLDKHGDYVEK